MFKSSQNDPVQRSSLLLIRAAHPAAAARQPCPNHATASGSAKRILKGDKAATLRRGDRPVREYVSEASSHICVLCVYVSNVECQSNIVSSVDIRSAV